MSIHISPDDAREILSNRRWKADTIITNHFNERWWLKQEPGYITECCWESAPCDYHSSLSTAVEKAKKEGK